MCIITVTAKCQHNDVGKYRIWYPQEWIGKQVLFTNFDHLIFRAIRTIVRFEKHQGDTRVTKIGMGLSTDSQIYYYFSVNIFENKMVKQ